MSDRIPQLLDQRMTFIMGAALSECSGSYLFRKRETGLGRRVHRDSLKIIYEGQSHGKRGTGLHMRNSAVNIVKKRFQKVCLFRSLSNYLSQRRHMVLLYKGRGEIVNMINSRNLV